MGKWSSVRHLELAKFYQNELVFLHSSEKNYTVPISFF